MIGGHELLQNHIDKLKQEYVKSDSKIKYDIKRHISSTPEHKILETPGWYRVFEFDTNDPNQASGSISWLPTFTIFRGYWSSNNEIHQIQLIGRHKTHAFINENSSSGSFIVQKIRLVATSKNAFVDIYYNSTVKNQIIGSIVNGLTAIQDRYWYAIPDPYMVDETVNGETILVTHDFQKNYRIESRLAALENALASATSNIE